MSNNATKTEYECLTVTDVKVYPFSQSQGLNHIKGLATIVFNDQFTVRGLRVMDGENGLFVGYPNDPFYKGDELKCICQPISRQLREHIENVLLEKYQEEAAKIEDDDD